MSYSGLSDTLFCFTLAGFALPLSKIPLYLLFLLTSFLVILGWAIFTGSLAFYFQRLEAVVRSLREGFLSFSFYPFFIYEWFTQFILLVIIPAEFSITFFSLAVCFFYLGLRKYESGNVIAMRG